jgi:hypothetical protein
LQGRKKGTLPAARPVVRGTKSASLRMIRSLARS